MPSKYHRAVAEILFLDPLFRHHKIVEEYPVQKVNASWYSARHRFDLAILDLAIVIEVHGQDHYQVQLRDASRSAEEIEGHFHSRQHLDWQKQQAALDVGWIYVAIPYWEIEKNQLTAESLMIKIHQAIEEKAQQTNMKYGKMEIARRPRNTVFLDYQRTQRKAQYQKAKLYREALKKEKS